MFFHRQKNYKNMDFHTISAVGGGILSIIPSLKFVKEGEIGVITTFGKAQRTKDGNVKTIGSGFRLIVPMVQQINRIHTQKNTDTYTNLTTTIKSGLSYTFNAYIVYHVKKDAKSVENVIFSIENYKEYVSLIFEKAIQDVLQNVVVLDIAALNEEVKTLITPLLDKEGVELDDCGLISFAATEFSQSLLGINYKLSIVRENLDVDSNIIATAIGATPTISVDRKEITNNKKTEEE